MNGRDCAASADSIKVRCVGGMPAGLNRHALALLHRHACSEQQACHPTDMLAQSSKHATRPTCLLRATSMPPDRHACSEQQACHPTDMLAQSNKHATRPTSEV
jgi:hypothetical protein